MKYLAIFLVATLIYSPLLSQPGPKTYSIKDKRAIQAYEEILEQYKMRDLESCVTSLEKLRANHPEFAEAHFLLAQVFLEMRKTEASIDPMQTGLNVNDRLYPDGWLDLSECHFALGHYDEAEKAAMAFIGKPQRSSENVRRAQLIMASCVYARESIKYPVPFDPVNLGNGVNSPTEEYYPCMSADGQMLLFTRLVHDPSVEGGIQEDFYVAEKKEGIWEKAVPLQAVNTPMNEGAPSLSADGKTVIFTVCEWEGYYGANRQGFGSCDLFFSQRSGMNWSTAKNLGPGINSSSWESQPSYSADGRSLYFVRGKWTPYGIKEQDIYFATIKPDGQWSSPVKVVGKVNTPGNEESVQIHPDGRTLYFSSDGHIGMGGLDIYVSHLQTDGTWGEPQNMGYPINTYRDENSVIVSTDGQIALFASDREGGYGGLDLYEFPLHEKARPGAVTYVHGFITDALSFKKLEAHVELISLDDGKLRADAYSDPVTGEFLVCIPSGKDYALNVSREGYLFHSENFSLREHFDATPYRRDVELKKLKKDAWVILDNVFFDSNSAELKPESRVELDKVSALLKANPTVKVEIGGFTDNVGSDADNLKLSDNRAHSVVAYLVSAGIEQARLSARGYGEAQPIDTNETEAGRANNRRTQMKIIE
ncbi:MAG: PD40 domain-containing protein [Flavobacteriales bacterium]|nr:PD40 domain-containing protein [Flavobacteriales bacterium]